ncbi:peptidoglycan editing factor PgeF [Algivirga pacifica]|uniref:Purine nucleoside phosphorylase n=1 Tax=Algivirga pacifica TaxID=1162670 RepID=A0ABP9DEF2_9BACT
MLIKKQYDQLPLYHFEHLSKQEDIKHYISSREGGNSEEHLSSLNIGLAVNDHPENPVNNRAKIATALGISPSHLIFPSQTHSDHITVIEDIDTPTLDTDALITNKKGICISVMTADCVPVLLYDPVAKAVAAIHAGWRGSVEDICGKTIQLMKEKYNCQPQHILAGIGPSICVKNYETGAEVIEAVQKLTGDAHPFIASPQANGKANLDLWTLNQYLLQKAGVLPENIEIANICTFERNDLFYSARRGKTGRFGSGILLQ